MSVIKHLSH